MAEILPESEENLQDMVPACDDVAFKKVLIGNPPLLAEILKCVLTLPPEEYEGMQPTCSEVLPDSAKGKLGRLDIKVRTKSDIVIDIEMERGAVANLPGRILFYMSGLIKGQMFVGDSYEQMRRVIGVVITENPIMKGDSEYHHRFTLYDLKTGSTLTDLIEVNTLELSKLPQADDGSDLWGWMKFLTIKRRCELEQIAERGPAYREAAAKLSEFTMSEEARWILERRFMIEKEEAWLKREAEREKAEAVVAGRAEGKAEGKAETAKAMKAEGFDPATIARITGLTTEDIQRL